MNQKDLIEQRLAGLGMTWYGLAQATGLHHHTIYKIKQGKIQARQAAILHPIAEVLMLNPDDLAIAGGHVPEDVHRGIVQHPELLPIIRNLITKIEAHQG